MLTEDYFMRMINQMLAVLTKIITLRDTGLYNQAQDIINQSLEQLLGIPPDLLRQMDDQSLLNLLTTQEELVSDRLYMVANLYELEGTILHAQNRLSEAELDYARALTFYLEVALRDESQYSNELTDKIEEMQSKLINRALDTNIYIQLFDYYERLGKFALVEKQISNLLQSDEETTEIVPVLVEYYQSLLKKDDQELIAGGVTRDQIRYQLKSLTH
ncbi:MAG: hypothetical protein JSV42_04155 [Chloroflexota bacterium]|nr:MAG: hypothetical protein JSV42_04155 [Chloroflexota bacterium]